MIRPSRGRALDTALATALLCTSCSGVIAPSRPALSHGPVPSATSSADVGGAPAVPGADVTSSGTADRPRLPVTAKRSAVGQPVALSTQPDVRRAIARSGLTAMLDRPGLRVVRAGQVAVVGRQPTGRLRRIAQAAAAGTAWDVRLTGRPVPPGVVIPVLCPDTQDQYADLAGPGMDQSDGFSPGNAPLVVLRPDVVDEALEDDFPPDLLVTHEIFHALTIVGASETMPTWLMEGVAEYAGRGIVGSDGVWADISDVTELPTGSDFDSEDMQDRARAYEASYSFVRYLVRRAGEPRLMAFYDEARRDTAERLTPTQLLLKHYGFDETTLVRDWTTARSLEVVPDL
ncbi:hypothetical protein PZ938_05155 [Luteipulveratus sp. YIM 133132]|uniref:hypothetical protein n=1 Tax=Luteipulveratus flavus TaxID=3031728 RepID=UPI0023AF09F7|nr:hypothetical protein [Luteipulveratus sp. YIM 133132]MDE9364987.1 hypothetical protein [Luteipulveratus sp. YIM 133132]